MSFLFRFKLLDYIVRRVSNLRVNFVKFRTGFLSAFTENGERLQKIIKRVVTGASIFWKECNICSDSRLNCKCNQLVLEFPPPFVKTPRERLYSFRVAQR